MDQDIRNKIMQRIKQDPNGVLKILKNANISLSPAEEKSILNGELNTQLEQRFNAKILGMMGMMSSGGKTKGEKEE